MKNENKRRKRLLERILMTLVVIVFAVVGIWFCWKFLYKPMTEEEYKMCEKVAQNIAETNWKSVEVPEGFEASIQRKSITVSISSQKIRGELKVSLKDGELIFTRYSGIVEAIFISILGGMGFGVFGWAVYRVLSFIYNYFKE